VPSDFQPFGPLKEALGGRRFRCDKHVKNVAKQRLRAQAKTSHCDGSVKFLGRWEKCVANRVIMLDSDVLCSCDRQ
jgi:hypothetical protein